MTYVCVAAPLTAHPFDCPLGQRLPQWVAHRVFENQNIIDPSSSVIEASLRRNYKARDIRETLLLLIFYIDGRHFILLRASQVVGTTLFGKLRIRF